ncbi:MAG TPA: PDR/VanB family oxidoreductase [Burkholderiaceae bacterium]
MADDAFLSAVVHTLRLEAQGILSLELRPLPSVEFPSFEAGSHIDLHLPNGLSRSYSLFNSPTDRNRYVVGVLNDVKSRGGSRYVHEQLRVGQVLKLGFPRNNFRLEEDAPRTVLVAGGIGVTPILCMFNRMRALGRPVEMLYCARSRGEAAFADELMASGGQVRVRFDDETGAPPDLKDLLAGHPAETHFYCCGPTPMLNAFEAACKELRYAHCHVERFAPADEVTAVQVDSYQVTLTRSRKTIDVPSGINLLDALLQAGVECEYSCREGVCGVCETSVIDGEIDHRDSVLSAREREAGKTMMICVSGCKGRKIVLDL